MGAANESVISLSEAAKPIEVEEAYPEVAEAGGAAPLDFVEDICVETDASAPTDLPYWACTYCNIHSPASVVKCAATGKWFCNSKVPGLPASCIIYHLVRSKHNEVVLHKESPLGEITLECFLTGGKNVFQLGFVPVEDDLVVLLRRDVDINRDEYDWDLSKISAHMKFLF